MEWHVILIEDSFVYVNAGKDRGLQVGDFLTVTRPGKAVVDPVSGDTLGDMTLSIAKLRVQYVAPHYSRTYPLEIVSKMVIQLRDRVVRWEGERIGVVPMPQTVDLEVEEPRRASGGDQIFIKDTRRTGDVVGDFEFEGEILDYDLGDLDGDGVNELVAMELRKLSVYRIVSGVPEAIWTESIRGFQYIVLEIHDADGDGKQELYVGQKLGNVARTDVYRMRDGRVLKAGEIKGVFVRQIGEDLYAQRYGFAKPFAGPIMEIRYDPNANVVTKVRDLADGAYNILAVGIGKSRMAYLDFNDRLTIVDRSGQMVWRGTNALGGGTHDLVSGNGREKEEMQKKIMFDDFDGNASEDLLVVKNELNPFWGVTGLVGGAKYKNGKFMIYTDRPGGYDVLKETREFEGYVTDYEFGRVGGADRQLSLCLVSAAGRQKFKSRIIVLREL